MTAPAAREALGAAIAEASAPAEAEQLGFLPPLRAGLNDTRRAEIAEGVRRRGRPPGAQNVATRQALDFIRRVFGDPLIERARWLLLSPDELASAIGCTTAEAFDRQDAIRADLARFFYATRAPVDGDGNAAVPTFHLSIGGGPGAAVAGADRPPWEYLELLAQKPQQNQAFSTTPDPVSHDAVSHERPK